MTEDLIFIRGERWYRVTDQSLEEIAPWPRLAAPARVVFAGETLLVMGVERLEGKRSHAAARIEKRLRQEGLVEGPAHVRIESALSVPGGVKAFFGAVALEFWQRLSHWADGQPEHCLLLPLSALLARATDKGRACVAFDGARLHLYGYGKDGPFYGSVAVLGETEDAVPAAARSIAGRHRSDLDRGVRPPVMWHPLMPVAAGAGAAAAKVFAEAGGIAATTAPPIAAGGCALPALVERAGPFAGAMRPLARLAWLAERAAPVTAVATLVAALGFGFAGSLARLQAEQETRRIEAASASISALEERIRRAADLDVPQAVETGGAFARQLAAASRFDAVALLRTIGSAAGQEIRVTRLRLETAQDGSRSFRVDGVGGNTQGLADFLNRLRRSGWEAMPLEPADAAAGAFSYRLAPAAPPSKG